MDEQNIDITKMQNKIKVQIRDEVKSVIKGQQYSSATISVDKDKIPEGLMSGMKETVDVEKDRL